MERTAVGARELKTRPDQQRTLRREVENGTLSFHVWRGTDQPCKTSYKGTLSGAGDEITLEVTGAPGRGGAPAGPQTIVAKRVK
jgi:hypothetical protein